MVKESKKKNATDIYHVMLRGINRQNIFDENVNEEPSPVHLKIFAEIASATQKQMADWFVWLASTLGRFNANKFKRTDHEVRDIVDGRYNGRIQKYQQGMLR